MDSLSQLVLGAAVGVAVMGRRTALWKAALWGGICGTLPDLDAFVDQGDAIRNMTLHRAHSHALFYLTLLSLPLAAAIARLHRQWQELRYWWLAVWLALITHPLLDWMTVYGTQLGRPFTTEPFGLGSIFIIDPLYTLPLLVGVVAALRLPVARALRWNTAGLVLSTSYLLWSALVQQHVTGIARQALAAQGLSSTQLLVTPTPLNTVAWRILAISPDGYHEGFYALTDASQAVTFTRFARGQELAPVLAGNAGAQSLAAFSHGFYKLSEKAGQVYITDLRMGQEPHYLFQFRVAQRNGVAYEPLPPQQQGMRTPLGPGFRWLGRRILGEPVEPPR
ncbi:MAG: metal-dependent hydrolase [Burkholderiales bacterium]